LNDKKFRDTKRRVEGLIERWRRILWITQWKIDVTYFREPPADMDGPGAQCAHMDIVPRWEYMTAAIRVNMPQVMHLDLDDLERTVMHELLHCVVCEMRHWTPTRREHEERVVSHLTKAMWAARLTGWDDSKADLRKKQRAEAKAKSTTNTG